MIGITLQLFPLNGAAQYISRSANPAYKTVYLDTIHLRGIVLDYTGKPLTDMAMASLSYYHITGKNLLAKTDGNGKFTLDGANPNDTLVTFGVGYPTMWFYNRGSRYVEITLPQLKPNPINSEADPIAIQAKATGQHKKLKLTYEEINCYDCGPGPMYESPAQFPGGNDRLLAFIKRQLVYPEQAIKNNVQGLVKVSFWIEKDGSIISPHIIQGIGYGCDEEVIRLISKSPKWKPASSRLVVPESIVVEFKLTDK